MNKKAFVAAVKELGEERGIEGQLLIEAITEAFKISLNKKLEDENRFGSAKNMKVKKIGENAEPELEKLPPANIKVDCDLVKGNIDVYYLREVMNDDDITDDFLQISLEDAREIKKSIKIGDFIEEPIDLEDFSKKDVDKFVGAFKQRLSRAEKELLLETFSSKIGQLITGVVEKYDSKTTVVNLGKATTTMDSKRDLIGGETYKTGDQILVYVQSIGKDENKKQAVVKISRSCKEFLIKLFERNVNEIYDHTIEIVDVARKAGIRSKVVVKSNDLNVDPAGACIGKNGDRIQRIVLELGNSHEKEKIDVIEYKANRGLYLASILAPGEVIGINFVDNRADVITKEGTMKLAVGLKGCNISLAKELLGLSGITVYDESAAVEAGITEYKTIEAYTIESEEQEKAEEMRIFREKSIAYVEAKRAEQAEQSKLNVQESMINYKDLENLGDLDETLDSFEEIEEKAKEPIEIKINMDKYISSEPEQVEEEAVAVTPKKETPVEHKEVQITTTLESLEKSLAEEKKNKPSTKTSKNKKKKDDKKDEESSTESKTTKKMDIYTEEELKEFDDEDFDNYDNYDDEYDDYSDYDSDDFYDEDK